ncbi:MAG: FAD-dependent oxidoreductase [Candidatus Uhrbacteria bacterium]|nr:FAD-dependent oxidoreductase [Candidatus Uhrbacteria bacterium]
MYDVIVIGHGVTGAGLEWVLSRYSNATRILGIERRKGAGMVNSNVTNNSQTLHKGDIESNYPLDKALQVKWGADLLGAFVDQNLPHGKLVIPKQLIAVGDEVDELTKRFHQFKPHYPDIQLLDGNGIAELEPLVMEGRDPKQKIASLYSPRGHAVNYHLLAEKFVDLAKASGKEIDIRYNTSVQRIERTAHGFNVHADGVVHSAKFVSVSAGSASLLFAHALGYELDLALLPVAGSFYTNKRVGGLLQGKVYTMQDPKLPFAAVHGDPAVYNTDETRFGPTARPLPLLERDSWRTLAEFLDIGTVTPRGIWSLLKIISDPTIGSFALWNMVFDIPWIGKHAFLRDARKIVPSLGIDDIMLDKGAGGVRGQPISLKTGSIVKGRDRFIPKDAPIAFTLAPSPGASYCLGNAVELARAMVERVPGFQFDEQRLLADLKLDA